MAAESVKKLKFATFTGPLKNKIWTARLTDCTQGKTKKNEMICTGERNCKKWFFTSLLCVVRPNDAIAPAAADEEDNDDAMMMMMCTRTFRDVITISTYNLNIQKKHDMLLLVLVLSSAVSSARIIINRVVHHIIWNVYSFAQVVR